MKELKESLLSGDFMGPELEGFIKYEKYPWLEYKHSLGTVRNEVMHHNRLVVDKLVLSKINDAIKSFERLTANNLSGVVLPDGYIIADAVVDTLQKTQANFERDFSQRGKFPDVIDEHPQLLPVLDTFFKSKLIDELFEESESAGRRRPWRDIDLPRFSSSTITVRIKIGDLTAVQFEGVKKELLRLAKAAHVRKYKWDSILDMAAVKGDEETIKKLSTTTEPALFCELELEI